MKLKTKIKKKWLAVSLIIVALLGYGGMYLLNSNAQEVKTETTQLTTYQLQEQEITKTIFGDGIIKSSNSNSIYSQLNSNIVELLIEEGTTVNEGDIIAMLDDSDLQMTLKNAEYQLEVDLDSYNDLKAKGNTVLQASYDKALADYNNAKDDYEKNKDLYQSGAISETALNTSKTNMDKSYIDYVSAKDNLNTTSTGSELNKLEAKIEIDKLDIEQIQKDLEYTTIKAPITGTVTYILETTSKSVKEGDLLFIIEDLGSLIVESSISEYEINEVAVDQKVSITTLGLSDKEYNGIITSVSPSGMIEGSEVLVEIEIDITDEDTELKPNFTTNIEIIVAEKANALVVPYDAITKTPKGDEMVMVISNGEQKRIPITRGIESELYVEVISDELAIGDEIVIISDTYTKSTEERGMMPIGIPGTGGPGQGGGQRKSN